MATDSRARRPVIFDTDMGSDDWLAALLLLNHPAIEVKAITVTGTGLAHVHHGIRHAHSLAALAGQPDIAVAGGRETPLDGNNTFPTSWRDATDSFSGLKPDRSTAASKRSAVETILAHSRESGLRMTIVATGPLTNLADALRQDPLLKDRLAMVYIMGGALKVPGNVHAYCPELPNKTAEWNFYIDPTATAEVIESGVPVTLIPLDATDAVPVTPDFVNRLENRQSTSSAKFILDVLNQPDRQKQIKDGSYYFWDSLAAAVAIDECCSPPVEYSIRVDRVPPDEGTTRFDENGVRVRVCRGADRTAFERLYLDAVAPGPPSRD